MQVEAPPVTPRQRVVKTHTQADNVYAVLACTATVWLHCAKSLADTAPFNA